MTKSEIMSSMNCHRGKYTCNAFDDMVGHQIESLQSELDAAKAKHLKVWEMFRAEEIKNKRLTTALGIMRKK